MQSERHNTNNTQKRHRFLWKVHTGFGATYVAIQATSKQLKLYIKQEWERIPPEKLQKLVSSVPKRLLSVVKRKGDVTQW